MRLNAKGATSKIESWVYFALNHESDIQQLNQVPLISVKEESKDSFCELGCSKKKQIKMLEKISFKQQMLIEFKRFSDGMLSKMDEQNQFLSHLISSQRSIYTSTPVFKNDNFKLEKYEINRNTDQCEIVEHNFEVPELFRGPYNPYDATKMLEIFVDLQHLCGNLF